MYSALAKVNDKCVITQLYIADEDPFLRYDAMDVQSFERNRGDNGQEKQSTNEASDEGLYTGLCYEGITYI